MVRLRGNARLFLLCIALQASFAPASRRIRSYRFDVDEDEIVDSQTVVSVEPRTEDVVLDELTLQDEDVTFWGRILSDENSLSMPSPPTNELRRTDRQHALARNGVDLFLQESVDENCVSIEKAILLIHGLTYSSHEFDVTWKEYSLVERLLGECYSVWSLDIAGYGRSGVVQNGFHVDSDYASKDIAAASSFITKPGSNFRELDMLGWSWGTVAASRMVAADSSNVIRRLILYAPILYAYDGSPPTEDYHMNTWEHAASDFQMDATTNEIDYSIAEPSAVHLFLSNCWRYDGLSSPNGGRRDLLAGSDSRLFDFALLNLPVLVVAGSRDPYMYWDRVRTEFEFLPMKEQSLLVEIPEASHILMLEKDHHQKFHRSVVGFLREL